ncbi:MAG: hypothetical protein QM770_11355 [Tepidisphaeraceae bacterium]
MKFPIESVNRTGSVAPTRASLSRSRKMFWYWTPHPSSPLMLPLRSSSKYAFPVMLLPPLLGVCAKWLFADVLVDVGSVTVMLVVPDGPDCRHPGMMTWFTV